MTKRMLIDTAHDEETRVAIVDGERLEEYEYESTFRKALKGSIFLAKVTRVEPSLQAAFVNFGGNRHGFLPFSEIHPDYFRIPISDREALLEEQEEELKKLEEEEEDEDEDDSVEVADDESDVTEVEEVSDDAEEDEGEEESEAVEAEEDSADSDDAEDNQNNKNRGRGRGRRGRGRGRGRRSAAHSSGKVESFGDDMDEEQRFRFKMRRKYKIQEVIKRGQIMLVQVSKEERGNKGAAVGSYLSLPGRYCVLMPNSPRAGGISRKISNNKDRAKMRELLKGLEVPKGMSVILRTAGVTRTKADIKRDLEYLMRLWNNIRELTLESSAPALVYEEANLVKRAVRDLYTREIDEVVVAGSEGYKVAKDFMKMMIPSHVKKVKEYKETKPALFQKYNAERQISEIGETSVTLKSGGYLVINPTEALISIDVNSGKATKERHIEETALKTNLEAAEEVARQLRLRDLGGLVVVDFIDMEDRRNNGKVERKMRESLSGDRARIQMGRISSFGLMELSRQRLNPSLTESQYEMCSHCGGTGRTRTADAASIMLLRAIEDEAARGRAAQVIVHVSNAVALYLLNQKREHLSEIENSFDMNILIRVDDDMGADGFRIEVSKPADKNSSGDEKQQQGNDSSQDDDDNDNRGGRRRGRRGGRRRGGRNRQDDQNTEDESDDKNSQADSSDKKDQPDTASDDKKGEDKPKKQGRRSQKDKDDTAKSGSDNDTDDTEEDGKAESKAKPKRKAAKSESSSSSGAKKKDESSKSSDDKDDKTADKAAALEASNDDVSEPKKKPSTKGKKSQTKTSKDDQSSSESNAGDDVKEYETVNEPPAKKKKGWWSKS